MSDRSNLSAPDALTRLRDGNRRYTQNVRSVDSMLSHSRRDLPPQPPFAIVLGCSDSRAPAEIVFDQGLGDLFVIRVAGNIVAPSQVGIGRVRRRALRHAPGGGHGPHALRRHRRRASRRSTGAHAAGVAQPDVDRQPRAARASSRWCATDLARDPVRLRREAMRANVRASVEPPAPRLGDHRAAGARRRAAAWSAPSSIWRPARSRSSTTRASRCRSGAATPAKSSRTTSPRR